MPDLSRLRTVLRSSESSRRGTLEAIRQIVDRFPDAAHDEFEQLLRDPAVGIRPKVFVLFWLREFGKFEDLVEAHSAPFLQLMDAVVRDVDEGEESEIDSFSVEDSPDE
jgi:hypothetical protein